MLYNKTLANFSICIGISLTLVGCNNDNNEPTTPIDDTNSQLIRSDAYPGITCEELSIPMRDGILTTGFVYRPDEDTSQQYPTIITRSPYSRSGYGQECFLENDLTLTDGTLFAQSGYAFIIQSVRGTYTSDGEVDVLRQEKNDGYDSVEWAAGQEWSNGNVGIKGGSYLGVTTWQTTISAPPSLKAASIAITAEDYHREWVYDQGIPHHSFNISWLEAAFTTDEIIRQETAKGTSEEIITQMVADRQTLAFTKMWSDWVWQLPLTSFTEFDEFHNTYQTWLEHPDYDEFWQEIDVGANIEQVNFPVLILGAWYDIFADGTVASYNSMKSRAGSIEARDETKLLIGIFGHSTDHSTPSFGIDTILSALAPTVTRPYDMDYFDRYLKSIENGYDEQPNVTLTVMVPPDAGQQGSNFVIEAPDYPLANTEYRSFYLNSDGNANDRAGSGGLSLFGENRNADISTSEAVDTASFAADLFSYDPLNPVPTMGGNLCCGTDLTGGPKSGAVEQAEVEIRDDVLVYTSAPLIEPLVVIGPVSVELFAKSSAMNTDFMAKLVDVRPDGSTHNILDGAVRASLRNGSKSQPSLIEPNKTYKYSINLGDTGTVFPVGHRIRLQVTSSNFPKFARNLNTGASNETTSETMVANQVILHDVINASRLILPIAEGIDIPN
ncbi:CocE/NonD family hydrolase [Psychromonas sp. SR45-3]|uniref:CocE/NonD family hydrolase n=1 Tax=Psychromonas sp. SR45-3 TaxID=2760930 RepID=UPI0015F9A0D5|nr:CocE/NonD family hydrolase [Psychromonas sp. SR45-3]MBB1272214.1 CocE/NonD family hydrolase [Psychromonas sp. SR45-3]